jgi:hypothetical protein
MEIERREYYEQLLLKKTGLVQDDIEILDDLSQFPTIRRATTLSNLRNMAANIAVKRSISNKEAKDRFEAELDKANNA